MTVTPCCLAHKLMPHQLAIPIPPHSLRLLANLLAGRTHAPTPSCDRILTFSDLGGRIPPPSRANIALSFVSSFVRIKHALSLDIPTYITPYLPTHAYTVLFQAYSSLIPSHPFTVHAMPAFIFLSVDCAARAIATR